MSKHDDEGNNHIRHVELPLPRPNPPALTFIASPLFDMILSLHIAFNASFYSEADLDPQWIERARAACSPDLVDRLSFYFGEEERGGLHAVHIYGIFNLSPDPQDILATLAWMETIPVEEVLIPIMESNGLGDDWREVARSIIQQYKNAESRDEVMPRIAAFIRRYPPIERLAVRRLLEDPEGERLIFVGMLRQWYEGFFAAEAERIMPSLRREVEFQKKRQMLLPPAQIFTEVIHGIAFEMPAHVTRIILAPSVMIMPIVFSFTVDDTLTYCYPILESAKTAAEQEANSRREMVRLFEALADDTRLRILRHLADRQMYLTELSEHLKLTKATTRHHMIRLRAAGLVTVHMRDHLSYYSLRRETLEEPSHILARFLGTTQATQP